MCLSFKFSLEIEKSFFSAINSAKISSARGIPVSIFVGVRKITFSTINFAQFSSARTFSVSISVQDQKIMLFRDTFFLNYLSPVAIPVPVTLAPWESGATGLFGYFKALLLSFQFQFQLYVLAIIIREYNSTCCPVLFPIRLCLCIVERMGQARWKVVNFLYRSSADFFHATQPDGKRASAWKFHKTHGANQWIFNLSRSQKSRRKTPTRLKFSRTAC